MTQKLNIWLGPEIIYVYGTVNGDPATFTLSGEGGVWSAVVPRAEDDTYLIYVEAYSAAGMEYSLTRTVQYLEGWVTPKTDWRPSDYYNPGDYNRQTHNLGYIAGTVLPSLAYAAEYDQGEPVDYGDYPVANRINALESGLSAIAASGVPLPHEWQSGKTWSAGGASPDYTDANRWEGNVLAVYEMAGRVAARWRPAGTFAAGQANILPRRVM